MFIHGNKNSFNVSFVMKSDLPQSQIVFRLWDLRLQEASFSHINVKEESRPATLTQTAVTCSLPVMYCSWLKNT
jgi:hypothetical protein